MRISNISNGFRNPLSDVKYTTMTKEKKKAKKNSKTIRTGGTVYQCNNQRKEKNGKTIRTGGTVYRLALKTKVLFPIFMEELHDSLN